MAIYYNKTQKEKTDGAKFTPSVFLCLGRKSSKVCDREVKQENIHIIIIYFL